jgi:hypothetical protein
MVGNANSILTDCAQAGTHIYWVCDLEVTIREFSFFVASNLA